MKKLIYLIIFALLAFYAAWPAWSLYEIGQGIQQRQEPVLERKVAWEPLRASLREPVAQRVRAEIEKQSGKYGTEGILVGTVAAELTPQIVNEVLDAYVTPKGIIKLANQGGEIDVASMGLGNFFKKLGETTGEEGEKKEGIGGILDTVKEIAKQIPGGEKYVVGTINKYTKDLGKSLMEDVAEPAPKNTKPYGLDNIKHFAFTGPLSFEIGLSKNPDAKEADITAGMSFVGNDWKLSKLIPRLE